MIERILYHLFPLTVRRIYQRGERDTIKRLYGKTPSQPLILIGREAQVSDVFFYDCAPAIEIYPGVAPPLISSN